VDVLKGQKTGFYIDQRFNRLELGRYIQGGEKVLDLFCYTGGFGIHAAVKGAEEVVLVDESEYAVETCRKNALLNDVYDRCIPIRARVREFVEAQLRRGERYDVVIVDPPAFITSRERYKEGYKAYLALYASALKLLKEGGVIFASSCSYFISPAEFKGLLVKASLKAGVKVLFLGGVRGAGPDHPVDPANPATDYLKAFFLLKA